MVQDSVEKAFVLLACHLIFVGYPWEKGRDMLKRNRPSLREREREALNLEDTERVGEGVNFELWPTIKFNREWEDFSTHMTMRSMTQTK